MSTSTCSQRRVVPVCVVREPKTVVFRWNADMSNAVLSVPAEGGMVARSHRPTRMSRAVSIKHHRCVVSGAEKECCKVP